MRLILVKMINFYIWILVIKWKGLKFSGILQLVAFHLKFILQEKDESITLYFNEKRKFNKAKQWNTTF